MGRGRPEEKPSALYEAIALRLERLIRQGVLRPGDRLPSLRALSRKEGVNLDTAEQAYWLLERQGLLKARERIGFFVAEAPPLPGGSEKDAVLEGFSKYWEEGPIRDIFQRLRSAEVLPHAVSLSRGTLHGELLPLSDVARAIARVERDHPGTLNVGDVGGGQGRFRQQLSRWSALNGWQLDPAEIVVTCGALDAVNYALRGVARPGDAVGVEPLTYLGVRRAIAALGMRAVELPLEGGLAGLEEAVLTHDVRACVFVTRFAAPADAVVAAASRQEVVRLLTRLEVPIIEDDTTGDLAFGARALPFKAYDEAGMVLYCGSFSKTMAHALRVGWCAAGRYFDDVVDIKKSTNLSAPAFVQEAVATLLEDGTYRRHVARLRKTLQEAAMSLVGAARESFPPGTVVEAPTGGFVTWVELPGGVDVMRLFDAALREDICFPPGPLYSGAECFKRSLALSVGEAWSPRLEAGVRRLGVLACTLVGRGG